MSAYVLHCTGCGREVPDDGLALTCRGCGDGALLRTRYEDAALPVAPAAPGIFRYARWLPVRREVPGSCLPAVYRSEGLAGALGLTDLWISFSGYWPERGCRMESGTFKELEAHTVLGRIPEDAGTLVIASAGNTASAFAAACRKSGVRCLLVVPEFALRALEFTAGTGARTGRGSGTGTGEGGSVRVLALPGADYNDAIAYSRKLLAASGEFVAEGGVRNVGRRDGLGVVALAAYEAMGRRLPDHYVQAVGSGAGALGVYEAARRIIASDGSGNRLPRLILCQNAAYAPLWDAWHLGRTTPTRAAATTSAPAPAPAPARAPYAPELVNAAPPFAVAGGVRDALRDTDGTVLVADQAAALRAAALFEEREGIDIEPPAAVGVACLWAAVRDGRIPRDARILLNVTGGGRARLRRAQRPGTARRAQARAGSGMDADADADVGGGADTGMGMGMNVGARARNDPEPRIRSEGR